MTFAVMGLGTIFNALANRRDPASGLAAAAPQGARDLARPGRDDRRSPPSSPVSRRACSPQSLTGPQWLACFGLALSAAGHRAGKWLRRRRLHPAAPVPVEIGVSTAAAVATA